MEVAFSSSSELLGFARWFSEVLENTRKYVGLHLGNRSKNY